ncbi:MAG: aldo/keto reductase [Burkholderiales bacterium]
MQTKTLGRTGIQVSPLCLGTMMFGAFGNPDHDDCVRVIHAALDAGINFIDTADVYSQGESEQIIGKALAGSRRDNVVLATKAHFPMGSDPNRRGNSRRWIRQAVEGSLRRLGTDRIDLYQLHRPDPSCDIDESLGALSDLVREGKVLAIGTSTFPASQIVEAQWVAERRGRERFVTEQSAYSILVRTIEAEVLPTCQRHGLGTLVWSPLAGGWLAGKMKRDAPMPDTWRTRFNAKRFDPTTATSQRKFAIVDALTALAAQAGMTLIELSLRFVLEHPGVTSAIIGPRTFEQLQSQLSAPERRLSADVMDAIDALVRPGEIISLADFGYQPPAITDAATRRRPV